MNKKIPFDQCLSPEDKLIKALRVEGEALKQQVEQGKRDAVPEDIRKDAERYLWMLNNPDRGMSLLEHIAPDYWNGEIDRAIKGETE